MAKNSLFAILLRSPWWASLAIAAVLSLLGAALLPEGYRAVGALSSLPFVVVGALAARRQWRLPSAARVTEIQKAVAALTWPAFAGLLEQAFVRDGYVVQRGTSAQAGAKRGAESAVDFELERQGRRMLVSARRWKSARTGLDALRTLQAAREAADAPDALYIGLGEFTDQARAFAAEHRIAVWQAAEVAQSLRGLPLGAAAR
ncbi:MAG: restriction endonuclease [Burkholderiales bacterium]|nr:restriction endonuclease [Burkholderiales bacterium]